MRSHQAEDDVRSGLVRDGRDLPVPTVVIMAGGVGTRFWPASTSRRPKQFLSLTGERSLLQESYERARSLTSPDRILVLTNDEFVAMVREQLSDIPPANVIGEPARRDTAAAVVLGALVCRRRHGDCVMVVLTADHAISPVTEFVRCMASAVDAASRDPVGLYTFGIVPTHPSTGYGYLEPGALLLDDDGVRHHRLVRFHEKPTAETAAAYLAGGRHLWNSGMFVWRADAMIDACARYLPGHLAALAAAVEWEGTSAWGDELKRAFAALPAVSVDVGILERSSDVRMVEATFAWSDVGGWAALADFLPSDRAGNHHRGRLAARSSHGNVVYAEEEGELVALVGVEGLVVVRAGARTLVAHRDRVEEIKQLVQDLAAAGNAEDV